MKGSGIQANLLLLATQLTDGAPFRKFANPSTRVTVSPPVIDLPETESLVTGTSHNGLTVRAHGEIQNTERVAGQGNNLLHARVLPDYDLVLTVAVGADDLVRVFGPGQVADLAARVHLLDKGASGCVPEFNRAVCGTTTRSKQMVLVRGPGNSLDRGTVVGEAIKGSFVQLVPYHKLVVIAAGCQLTIFRVPLQSTNLLFVARQPPKVLIRRTNITVVDEAVSRTGCEDMVVPG